MTKPKEEILKSFIDLGLGEQKAKETMKNATVTSILCNLLEQVRL